MTSISRNRRIHFARFHTQAGRAGLDIGSAGHYIATFETFVEQVRRQNGIAVSRHQPNGASPRFHQPTTKLPGY